jgi:hypothetical protein
LGGFTVTLKSGNLKFDYASGSFNDKTGLKKKGTLLPTDLIHKVRSQFSQMDIELKFLNSVQKDFNNECEKLTAILGELKKNPKKEIVSANLAELIDGLDQEFKLFLKQNPSTETYNKLNDKCNQLISDFTNNNDNKTHSGWLKVDSSIRAIVGILALIPLGIPAIIVEMKSKNGFYDTFFSTPQTSTIQKTNEFKSQFQGLVSDKKNKFDADLYEMEENLREMESDNVSGNSLRP